MKNTVALTDVGLRREHNEDDFGVSDRVVVVADGLGGHAAGELASRLAVDTITTLAGRPDVTPAEVSQAFATAGETIRLFASGDASRRGMATCAVALVDTVDGLVCAGVGDCRAYALVDTATGVEDSSGFKMVRVSLDDGLVDNLVQEGRITPEQAWRHPNRNIVTAALGLFDDRVSSEFRASSGDPLARLFELPAGCTRVLLCSDGLSDYVPQEVIEVLLATPGLDAAAKELVDAALAAGAPDNVTVAVVDLVEV